MIYFDTSALVKLYYPEDESKSVSHWVLNREEAIPFTLFHELELNTALSARVFRGDVTLQERENARKAIESDLLTGVLIKTSVDWERAFAEALELCDRHSIQLGCRSLDIMHVACAMILGCSGVVSYDRRQRSLAAAAGLQAISV